MRERGTVLSQRWSEESVGLSSSLRAGATGKEGHQYAAGKTLSNSLTPAQFF